MHERKITPTHYATLIKVFELDGLTVNVSRITLHFFQHVFALHFTQPYAVAVI